MDVQWRMNPANTAVPSGPIEVRDCLTSHLIDRFNRPIYSAGLVFTGQQLTISICSLHLEDVIYAFFLFFLSFLL